MASVKRTIYTKMKQDYERRENQIISAYDKRLEDVQHELDIVNEKLTHKENELRLTRRVLGRHNTEYNTLLDTTGEIIAKYDECKTELQQYKALVADIREYIKGYEILNVFNRMIDNYGL